MLKRLVQDHLFFVHVSDSSRLESLCANFKCVVESEEISDMRVLKYTIAPSTTIIVEASLLGIGT